jgi:phosphate transport system permease protein
MPPLPHDPRHHPHRPPRHPPLPRGVPLNAETPSLPGAPRSTRRRRLLDRAFLALCIASASASVLILAVLLLSIITKGASHLDWKFLNAFPSRHAAEAGFKAALWGSVWLCFVCAAFALPLGVAAAVFLEESRPRGRLTSTLHTLIQLNIRNLAGVPSIVYGIIGLTVFVRCFGLLGNPNQYDRLSRITLADGRTIEALLLEDRPETLIVDITAVDSAERAEGMDWPTAVEIPRTIIQSPTAELDRAAIGDDVAFTLLRDLNLPIDLAFSLVPIDEAPTPPALIIHATLRERRPGALILDHPLSGRITLDAAQVRARQNLSARAHLLALTSGETLTADSLSLDHSSATLRIKGVPRTLPRSDIAAYTPLRPFSIADEASPFFLRLPLGGGILAGALTLALVILPIVIISSQEALRAVPPSLREAAFAAGATRWQVTARVVLPASVPGILTGAILAMSRAIGEAAPLLVIGGVLFITFTPTNLMSDFAAMPLQIYQWASRPQTEFHSVAAAGIIVLLAVLLLFNAAAILLRQKLQKPLS